MTVKPAISGSRKIPWNREFLLFILGIAIIATTLRTPLTVVGPIIDLLRDALHIPNVLAGFLTTIPLLAFAIVSPLAPRIANRFGIERTLFVSIALLITGILIRSFGTTLWLIVGTILIGIAIAFGNVLIPGFFKLKFPYQIGLLTGIYAVSMNISSGLGAGISYPIASTSFGWQGALGFSLLFTVLALILWLPQLKTNTQQTTTNTTHVALWRSSLVWAVTGVMGLQSFLFYTTSTWVPEILVQQGIAAEQTGWMISIMQLSQIPATFLTPIIATKLKNQQPIVISFTMCYMIGFVGLYMEATSFVIIWMMSLGLAGGASFSLAMMLFNLKTTTVREAARLSGFAQSIGYFGAAFGPSAFGLLYDFTNSWDIPHMIFIAITILLFISGMYAGQNKKIRVGE